MSLFIDRQGGVHHLYVIGPDNGPQKIGFTASIEARVKQLQVGNHLPLKLNYSVAVHGQASALKVEEYAHWILREKRLLNEWFAVTVEEAVAAIAAGHIEANLLHDEAATDCSEVVKCHLREGSIARINHHAAPHESLSSFIRDAVERELKRREPKK